MRKISLQLEGSREMDGVERTEVLRLKLAGCIQDPVVDSNEIEPLQHATAPGHGLGSRRQEGAKHFGTCQRARHERPSLSEIAADPALLPMSCATHSTI